MSREPETYDEKCDECKAKGYIDHGHYEEPEECKECDGTGWVTKPKPSKEEWDEKYGVEHD